MKTGMKRPFVPAERHDTIRREMIEALKGPALGAKEISARLKIREKDVYDHLEHIRISIGKGEMVFNIVPAVCRKCGFVFKKRDRISKPGKCPVCRGEAIEDPMFSIDIHSRQQAFGSRD